MSAMSTLCPRCQRSLEIPYEFDNVTCPGCTTAYWVRRHGELISLSEIWPDAEDSRRGENAAAVVVTRLAEIDELIEVLEVDIEATRSREQSGPLQWGCAFFGLFISVIMVIALFMLVGKRYIGSWLFYLAIGVVVLLGLARIRQKLTKADQFDELREERLQMEGDLVRLRAERDRIEELGENLDLGHHPSGSEL